MSLIIMSIIFHVYHILIYFSQISLAINSISQSISLIDDGNTLVSKGGIYELGFFTPGNSNKRYLGIWYKKIPIQTVVWVANRNNPINDSSGTLSLNNITGNLILTKNNGSVVWSTTSNSLRKKQEKPVVAFLLDTGNLVLIDENEENKESFLWQSFDYPTDTFLPEMKFGLDFKTGLNRRLTAWKSPDDPSPSDFSFGMVPHNNPDAYMMKGDKKFYRSGPWNGLHSSGSPQVRPNPIYDYRFVYNKDELYYTYSLKNSSAVTRLVLNATASVRYRYVWIESAKRWEIYTSVPLDLCDSYALCGAYSSCVISDSPVCQCMKGFKPKSPQAWYAMDWSNGCVRNKALLCEEKNKDGFVKLSGMKGPDTTNSWLDQTIGLEECRVKCLDNCSCMAYANSDVRGEGSGCALWFGDLTDIRQFAAGGQDLYVRMDSSELEHVNVGHKKKGVIVAVIVSLAIAIFCGILILGWCYRQKSSTYVKDFSIKEDHQNSGMQVDDGDLPVFNLSTIAKATNNFTISNKIGEGGFGPVYKGILTDGVEIAVKRLSTSSGQGLNEFKNEVKLIAKLQHRNLVKLLGCCLEGEEKMLVYEYMPNSSLDSFIFDKQKSELLDWSKRFDIICGIARGLVYLHQDSRLRIIHRDLKLSNVLLDKEMNPKISDFGMARIFGGDQNEGNTRRIVGTYGYMAPEYATDGLFSVKSDVFSFGVLLMEIISGNRSRGYYNQNQSHNLIGYAWKLWKEGRPLKLIDKNIGDSCFISQILHCIHVSLLCVQQNPEDRPIMSCVILMLVSDFELPEPKQPGFFLKDSSEGESSTSKQLLSSTNEITITLLEAR
ncbi:G-type lectin S-receptor-like serine/threonine-protein kinase At4g27290 isoform X1 [Trifolium pratense]|uniref:G-type lectin S-receptor-like serine/threonine-protein kinase At4g27290 isoform X1 n=1 Tax=Trifolium pratense TaxID=57577 RepID=UPI001E691CA1|nr:G-type lectin S-receptor-like serine/threonine-protein kinase At4g27290 isoform X1 [Trifolium pratense]